MGGAKASERREERQEKQGCAEENRETDGIKIRRLHEESKV